MSGFFKCVECRAVAAGWRGFGCRRAMARAGRRRAGRCVDCGIAIGWLDLVWPLGAGRRECMVARGLHDERRGGWLVQTGGHGLCVSGLAGVCFRAVGCHASFRLVGGRRIHHGSELGLACGGSIPWCFPPAIIQAPRCASRRVVGADARNKGTAPCNVDLVQLARMAVRPDLCALGCSAGGRADVGSSANAHRLARLWPRPPGRILGYGVGGGGHRRHRRSCIHSSSDARCLLGCGSYSGPYWLVACVRRFGGALLCLAPACSRRSPSPIVSNEPNYSFPPVFHRSFPKQFKPAKIMKQDPYQNENQHNPPISRREYMGAAARWGAALALGGINGICGSANAQDRREWGQSRGALAPKVEIEEFRFNRNEIMTGLEKDFTIGVRDLRQGITTYGLNWKPLRWRLFRPENLPGDARVPLVVFLHGAGEHGDDNTSQMKHRQPMMFVQPDFQAAHPCYFLAPQLEPGEVWWVLNERTPAPGIEMLVRALAEVLEKWPLIDRQRIYGVGLSTGGGGCWDAMSKLPHLFAACLIMGGVHRPYAVRGDIRGSAWLCYNEREQAIVREQGDAMLKEFATRGRPCRRSLGLGRSDHSSWNWALYQPGLVDWLWRQNLGYRIEQGEEIPPLMDPVFKKRVWQPG